MGGNEPPMDIDGGGGGPTDWNGCVLKGIDGGGPMDADALNGIEAGGKLLKDPGIEGGGPIIDAGGGGVKEREPGID